MTAADQRFVIGVDLGTGGPKVALATTRGQILGHEAETVELLLLPGGGVEQEPEQWWAAIRVATQRLLARGLVAVEDIAAICISSQWGGLVVVDADGVALRNAMSWMDSRGAAYSRSLTGGTLAIPGSGYDARSLREWVSKTGGVPTRTGKDPVGMAQWLLHHERDVYDKTAYFLDVPEYLTMRLTGRAVAGWDTTIPRWCTDNRDPNNVHWDPDLVRRCGFDMRRLPALVRPASVVGTIRPDVADELGLPHALQVVTGTGDSIAAAVGAGAVGDYQGHLYIGTSAWVSCHVPYKRTDVLRSIASMPASVPGRYWVATVQDVAGKAIDWLIDNVVYAEDGMLDAHPRPPDALARVNALALASPPGSNGVVFTPWLNGERTPVDDPYLRGGWFNVSLSTTRADLARAVFEGVALNARWMKEALDKFVSKERPDGLRELAFVGGGAQSDVWCQTLADVLGCRIKQVQDPVLANARGAALYAAIGIGELQWSDVPDCIAIAKTFDPNPAHRAVYDAQYKTFTALYRKNKRIYARRNRRSG